jgi:hypothetical protein
MAQGCYYEEEEMEETKVGAEIMLNLTDADVERINKNIEKALRGQITQLSQEEMREIVRIMIQRTDLDSLGDEEEQKKFAESVDKILEEIPPISGISEEDPFKALANLCFNK